MVTMTGSGAAAHVRLNQRPADDDPVFDFLLRAKDLGIEEAAAGGLKVTDGEKRVGMVSSLVAYDAKRDDAGVPINVVELDSELSAGVKRGKTTDHVLSLRAPDGFLDDPETEYPVTIDPDIAALTFAQDTWVRQGVSVVLGADPRVVLGRSATSTNTNFGLAYLQWSNVQIAGKTVVKATTRLYQYHAGTCDARSMGVYPLWSAFNEATTTWANKPTQNTTTGTNSSLNGNRGRAGCSVGDGYVTFDNTLMAQKWGYGPSGGGFTNYGMVLWPGSQTDATYEKAFCSSEPYAGDTCGSAAYVPLMSITYNGPPQAAKLPTPALGTSMRTWQGVDYVASTKPSWLTSATDSDGSRSWYRIEVHDLADWSPLKSSCETPIGYQGRVDGCTPTTALVNGKAYSVRARARDAYNVNGAWSGWRPFVVDATVPVAPTATCTDVAAGQWYETRPATSTTCTVSGNGADIDWRVNGVTRPALSPSDTTPAIPIPESGFTMIEFRSRTRAGAVSAWKQIGFGTGPAALLEPVADDRSSDAFPVLAAAPAGAETAKVQWRFAPQEGSETGPEDDWTDATGVKKADGGSWPGTLAGGGSGMSQTPALSWTPKVESGIASTALVQVRVVFAYPGGISKPSPLQLVQVVPHAFGGSFPTSAAGPGQVALFTGEFQYSETDVSVPGYGEAISLGRSHLSMAGTETGPAGVFGPGWKADLSGPEAGVAGFSVVDRTETDGSIVLNDPEGASFVYRHDSGEAGAQLVGNYVGVGETALEEDKLVLQAVSEPGITHRLTLTEWDSTKTVFVRVAGSGGDGRWVAEKVVGPEDNSTTRYHHDADGLITWIIAPAPPGVTCSPSSLPAGCRALELTYSTISGAKRLTSVTAHAYDPKPAADGTPSTSAAMSSAVVANYDYDTSGRLTASWDPRIADGTSALKTTYSYATVAGKTVLAEVGEPGLTPWEFHYATGGADEGRLTSITRAQTPAVGGTAATWTVRYDLDTSSSGGRPDLSAAATATWGQVEADAPVGGAAVWGPDRIPASSPSADDWEYASLSYWTKSGRPVGSPTPPSTVPAPGRSTPNATTTRATSSGRWTPPVVPGH